MLKLGMSIKLLQLNIFQGKYLDRIIDFVRKNDIDILNFQEVTGGSLSKGGGYNYDFATENIAPVEKSIGIDCIDMLKKSLSYNGLFVKTMNEIGSPDSYYGNGTFYKPSINLLETKQVVLNPYLEIEADFNQWEKIGRAGLFAKFEAEGKSFWVINAHLAWGPTPQDEEYKIKQAEKLYSSIKDLSGPLILSGDFNLVSETKTVSMFEDFGRNLTREYKLANTLNPRAHPAKNLFPPGLAVDNIFVSRDIKVKKFRLVDETDLSDHFGLLLEFEI